MGGLVWEGALVLMMGNGTEVSGKNHTSAGDSLRDQILCDGARAMLTAALQAEGTASVEAHAGEADDSCHRLVVRTCYPSTVIGAVVAKVRDEQVAGRPFSVVIGVTTDGERDILGIWAGDGGEDAESRLGVLTEITTHGDQDACIAVCDGVENLPESITTTWALTEVERCAGQAFRSAFRSAARQDSDAVA